MNASLEKYKLLEQKKIDTQLLLGTMITLLNLWLTRIAMKICFKSVWLDISQVGYNKGMNLLINS